MAAAKERLILTGTVSQSLANARFLVQLETGNEVHAYLTGNMRRHNIRVVVGDTVEVELSPYDITRGRITYRKR